MKQQILFILENHDPITRHELAKKLYRGEPKCPHCGKYTDEYKKFRANVGHHLTDLMYARRVKYVEPNSYTIMK